MRSFTDLVEEAARVDVSGWGFGWLDGRATEERPPWGYARLLASRLAGVGSALDVDTGGGELIAEVSRLPPRMVVTEGWPANVDHARRLLSHRGVEVVQVGQGGPLPFPDAGFELVSSRHPIAPDWPEIARVLADGGTYLAQHVGPASAFDLIEWFLGPLPRQRTGRDPQREADAARSAGLQVVDLRTARCRMEFFDIGAVVYILRKCVWWVPDFTVEGYREPLERLDAHIREHGAFVAHSSRTLIEARRRPRATRGRDREQRMPGGRNNGAVRVGRTVRRPVGTHTPAVHALLRHLEAVGFSGAPRALGVDDEGREVLSYLDGETVGDARPWPAWAHSDAALVAVGRWLRDFHAASRSFVPPPGAQWFGDHHNVRPGELIGHHDAAPYNAVWQAAPAASGPGRGELVGFVDWDLAGPAEPVRDLAFVALTWVPLTAHDVAAADGFPPDVDRSRRLGLLLDAYGWSGSVRAVLVAVQHRARDHAAGLRAAADSGYGPAVDLVAEGVADSLDRAAAELDASMEDLVRGHRISVRRPSGPRRP